MGLWLSFVPATYDLSRLSNYGFERSIFFGTADLVRTFPGYEPTRRFECARVSKLEEGMDQKIAGLLGAVAGLATAGAAQAAIEPAPNASEALHASSYADLLTPVPNAI